MDQPKPPAWLVDFQNDFSATLLTPLDTSSGHLRAKASPLAVYNQQYWFRLFGMLQTEFPLAARLVGFWRFNLYVMAFLRKRPPAYDSLSELGTGFAEFLGAQIPAAGLTLGAQQGRLPRAAVVEAARIDNDWTKVFASPETPAWRPLASEAAALPQLHLVASPGVRLIEEHWPLLEARAALHSAQGETRMVLPAPLPRSQWWALQRTSDGVMARLPLAPLQAQLLKLLGLYTVAEALTRFENANARSDLHTLSQHTQIWVAESVAAGFWCGAHL